MKKNKLQLEKGRTPRELLDQITLLDDEQRARVAAYIQQQLDISNPTTRGSAEVFQLLDKVDFLKSLTEQEKRELAERAVEMRFERGAFMTFQGADDNWMYVIAEGDAEIQVTIEGSNITKPVAEIHAGDYFGEMALLTGDPRKASVVAQTPVRCYRLGDQELQTIVRNRPEIVNDISDFLARRLLQIRAELQAKFSIFYILSEQERQDLFTRLEEVSFAPGVVIVEQGKLEDWMYILTSGNAGIHFKGDDGISRHIADVKAGDFFGEMSLLSGEPRMATVIASTRVDGYIFRKPVLDDLAKQYPNILDVINKVFRERKKELSSIYQEITSEQQSQQLRGTETGLMRRIRRFFAVGVPFVTTSTLTSEALTHSVTGRLFFESRTPLGKDKPLHNMYVELWDRGVFELFLGSTTTARDGMFKIWYNPAELGGKVNLELRIFETQHIYNKQGELKLTNKLVFSIQGNSDVAEPLYSFGDHRVPYWEYDPNSPIPRVSIVEQGDPPQSFPIGRSVLLAKVVAPLELAKQKHFLEYRLNKNLPSLEQIQKDYPENLSMRLEREHPGYTRSDEYFGERMLNGATATVFDKDESHPGWLRLYHHWNSYELDGIHALPNVDMRFEIRNEKLYPVQITLHLRAPGATAPNSPTEKITLTPQDGDRWMQAKRMARVSAALSAELDNHLVATHLNIEQYAIPAYRNLRKSPLRYLLFPHIKEVVLINYSANSFLLGPTGYVTRASALTESASTQRISQVLGTLDWKNWKPIQPICETHTYAKIANLYWEVLKEYVDDFFRQNEDEIVEHWYEVNLFSQELVQHSVPDFLCQYLKKNVKDRPGENRGWFNPEERMDISIPRHKVNGIPIALRPITLTNIPMSSDFANMKQVCAYVIYHATFKHTWANALQYDEGGEIVYNGLGLRYGDKGIFVPESDASISPPPNEASEQLWISCMLTRAAYGYIMRNEDNDINPALMEMLERRRADFAALGYDIDSIQSRTNI